LNENDIKNGTCPNDSCREDITQDNSISYFIEIPIAKQIRSLFSRPSFAMDICYRFLRKKCVILPLRTYMMARYTNLCPKKVEYCLTKTISPCFGTEMGLHVLNLQTCHYGHYFFI